jgi:hypothetical protein
MKVMAIGTLKPLTPEQRQKYLALPLWIILGAQCFRIGVELFLHQLWIEGLVPKMLTFEGGRL